MHAVTDDGPDLVEDRGADPGGQIAAGIHRYDPADPSGRDGLLSGGVARIEAADVAHHEVALRRPGGLHDGIAIGQGRGHRLLEEDVHSGFERRQRRLAVLVPHGRDADRLEFWVGQHLVVISKGLRDAEPLRHVRQPGPGARAQRVQLDVGQAGESLAVLLPEPAEPDDAVFDRVHGKDNPGTRRENLQPWPGASTHGAPGGTLSARSLRRRRYTTRPGC